MNINQSRLTHITKLMAEQSWDLLLLYGHTWRKDYFRCLVNFNFNGPHAVAAVDRSGEVRVLVNDLWDAEGLQNEAIFEIDFAEGLARLIKSERAGGAGLVRIIKGEGWHQRPTLLGSIPALTSACRTAAGSLPVASACRALT